MNPQVWGKHAWIFLHSITMAYPDCPTDIDKTNFKSFFIMLSNVLPCYKCKINYTKHMNELPLTNHVLNSKENLIKWLIDFHNLVNRDTGKKQLTYNEVNEIYSNLYGNNTKSKIFKIYLILFVFIILVIICVLLFWNKIK